MNYKTALQELIDSHKKGTIRTKTDFELILDALQNKKYFCIFSAGKIAKDYIHYFTRYGLKIDFLCDNDPLKHGTKLLNIPCISMDELLLYKSDVVINISSRYYKEIKIQLINFGFTDVFVVDDYFNQIPYKDYYNKHNLLTDGSYLIEIIDYLSDDKSRELFYKIVDKRYNNTNMDLFTDIYTDDEYFPKNIFNFNKNEIYIDAGAYDGDSILKFISKTNGEFKKVIAFEMDYNNFLKLIENTKNTDKIILHNKGLSNTNTITHYSSNGEASEITSEGNLSCELVRLDDFINNEDITYFKLDIEGSELDALHGACNTITNYKPKLAVCLYHRPEHLIEVILYIKKLVPEYKLYLRHHFIFGQGTVLYATL